MIYDEKIVDKARRLAQNKIGPRAAMYDQKSIFPEEDVLDLHQAGMLNLLISKEYGGEGLGHNKSDILTQWLVTKEFAKEDMSFARIWEGHSNAVLLLDNIANKYQKERWYAGILEHGHIWAAWSGEPQNKKPGVSKSYGTEVVASKEGFLINGTKIFCSGAPGVDFAVLFVSTTGSGGARHAADGSDIIMLACDMSDDSISINKNWWRPIGMKASVSHLVEFNNTFIPRDNLIGYPGQYIKEDWQTKLIPQYAACFLGSAEAAYEYALTYIKEQNRQADPYIQHRIARMRMNIETGNLWLNKTAELWTAGKNEAAILAGNSCRYIIEQQSMEAVQDAIHICGARALIQPSPLEKIYRDLSFYTRHDNDDHILSSIGRSILNEDHDKSFFRQRDTSSKTNE